MKKGKHTLTIALALLLCLVPAMLFAGGSSEATAAADDGKINLTVLNYRDTSATNSANEDEVVWDYFLEQNPDISLTIENIFGEPFLAKTEAYLASGNLPDVIYMWSGGKSASVHQNHAVKDLMPFLEKDGLVDDYNPAALVPQYGGYLAELPEGITASHMIFVNKTVLEDCGLEIPETLDDLLAMVPVLKEKGYGVFAMDNMTTWVMQSTLFSTIVGRLGGADWYDRLVAGEIDFTDDWFVDSLELVEQLYDEGVINRNSLQSTYGTSRGPFALNQYAFLVDGDWACSSLMMDNTTGQALLSRERQENDIELIVFPEIPGEVVHDTTSGTIGTGYAISADIEEGSAKEEAAWRLVKYLQGEHVQEYRLVTGQAFPTNLNVDVDKVIEENNLEPLVSKRAEFYNTYSYTPVIDDVLSSEVANVIDIGLQELGLGSKTPVEVAQDVQDTWEKWLDKQ